MNKKNVILLFASFLISFFIIETIFRTNSNLISREFLTYLPNTNVKKKILNKKGFEIKENLYKIEEIKNYKFKYYLNNFPSIDDETDIDLGATNLFYYNNGFCNTSFNLSDSKVIAVGDSFTYCTSVSPNQAWIKNIFKNINTKNKINFGYPGSGPFEYNLFLEKYISKKNILILYGFYEGNDLRDMINFTSSNKEADEKNSVKEFFRKIINNFYTGNFIVACYKKILSFTKPNFRYSRTNFDQKFNINNTDLDELNYAEKLFYERKISKKKYKNLLKIAFSEAKHIAKKNNNEIIFLFLPAAYSSFGKNIKFENKKIGEVIENYSITNSQLFDEVCLDQKLNCINLKDEFVKYNNESKIPSHFPSNVHFTKQGHSIVSQNIEKFVCNYKKDLLDKLNFECF